MLNRITHKKKSSKRAECVDDEKSMRIETHTYIYVKCQMYGRWRARKRMMVSNRTNIDKI